MTDRQTDRHMDKIAISILCVRTPVLMHVKKSFFRNMPRAKFWKCKKDWSTCHKLPADINHTVNLAVNTDKSHLLMSDDGLDKLVLRDLSWSSLSQVLFLSPAINRSSSSSSHHHRFMENSCLHDLMPFWMVLCMLPRWSEAKTAQTEVEFYGAKSSLSRSTFSVVQYNTLIYILP